MIYIHIYKNKKELKTFSRKTLLENISHYLNINIEDINIKYNQNGKPSIEGIYFSISHSGGVVVQAFSKLGNIGVDVEKINNKRKYLQLAKRYFHKQEYEYLQKLTVTQSLIMFYKLWSAKESVCKANGGRLWYYLAENHLTKNNDISTLTNNLNIQTFNKIPNYSLAIAASNKLKTTNFIYA